MTATHALSMTHVSKSFGGVHVLHDVSLDVLEGRPTALIGPNGAGKTTIFNVISGVYRPDTGRIAVHGDDVTAVPMRRLVHFGVARSFQNIRLMSHLTVLENLVMGQHARASRLRHLFTPFRLFPRHRWWEEARAALADAGLARYADDPVDVLPYGVRKRIDLVRAELAKPRILLLDEPAAGLNEAETIELQEHLGRMAANGTTLVVIEHDMNFVGSLCDHVVALNFGQKIAEGAIGEVRKDPAVRRAYLGAEHA